MIIDSHAHAFHGKYLESVSDIGGNWFKEKIAGLARIKPQIFDINLRLEWLERNGIDRQVVTIHHALDSNLFPADSTVQLKLARSINDNMAHILEDTRGKMIPIASVPIIGFESGGILEMERAIVNLGLKGVSLPSNLNGKSLDSPELEPFWAKASEMKIPVFIHHNDPAGYAGRSYEADYNLMISLGWPFDTMLALCRIVFSGILDRYPGLKIVSHMGGGLPFYWGRLNETYHPEAQLRTIGRKLPKPLLDYFSQFYYDTAIGGNAAAIKCMCDVFGTSQVTFATDAPWGPGTGEFRLQEYINVIKSLALSDEDKNKILGGNALRVININN